MGRVSLMEAAASIATGAAIGLVLVMLGYLGLAAFSPAASRCFVHGGDFWVPGWPDGACYKFVVVK